MYTPEELLEAEKQVDVFLTILSKRYGVKEDEIPLFIEAIRRSIERDRRFNQLSWHAILGVVSAVVMGALVLIWEGIKNALKH